MSAAAEEYRAAHRAAILVDRSDLGRLALRGRDALDLLHRLTTNGIKDLRPGQGAATLFTTPKGRILDLVLLHRLEEETLALTGQGRSQPVASWIERSARSWDFFEVSVESTRAPANRACASSSAFRRVISPLATISFASSSALATRSWARASAERSRLSAASSASRLVVSAVCSASRRIRAADSPAVRRSMARFLPRSS